MDAQLRELLTNYGDVAGIWFDGWWDRPEADWQLQRTYSLIHQPQPAALVGANHHHRPNPGEDFQMFEKDLPGGRSQGFNSDAEIGQLPLETCETMNGAWGFNITDRRYKSTRDLVRYLVRAAGANALLLNVGPMPNGRIQPEFTTRLPRSGAWTSRTVDPAHARRARSRTSVGRDDAEGDKVRARARRARPSLLLQTPSAVRSAKLNGGAAVPFKTGVSARCCRCRRIWIVDTIIVPARGQSVW